MFANFKVFLSAKIILKIFFYTAVKILVSDGHVDIP